MKTESFVHRSVLLPEAIQALAIRPDGCYVDATFGRGGHSREILKNLSELGCLLGIDKDAEAIVEGESLARTDRRFMIKQGSFSQIAEMIEGSDFNKNINGLLLDLGVSSPQLDDPQRGFSFQSDGPLDMRMNKNCGMTASQWLDTAEEGEIARVLKVYGEERFSRRIARAIVAQRMLGSIQTTLQLAHLIAEAIPFREKNKHPATRSFQAIRIFINEELDDLEKILEQSLSVLSSGARLVVISFHSLEDRIVKRFMRNQAIGDRLPQGVPVQYEQSNARLKLMGKPVFASPEEIRVNPRSRSAVMRVAEVL